MTVSLRLSGAVRLALLSSSVCVAACSSPSVSSVPAPTYELKGKTVQMNDVSVLYPLATTQNEFDHAYVSASDTGTAGTLFSKDLFEANIGDPPAPIPGEPVMGDSALTYSNLRVIAFRIDPCFANIGPITNPSACQNQLRLLFQSLSFNFDPSVNAGTIATDGAVHAFYSLSREEMSSLLAEVVAVREANSGSADIGPLAVNPTMVKQGLLGNEATALNQAILKYAGASRLTRFTTFHSQAGDTDWHFAGFDVQNGKATPMAIPTLPDNATSVDFTDDFSPTFQSGSFAPATTSTTDNMQLFASLSNAQAATPAQRQVALDASFRIENPNMNSPNTIDCASCHLAGPARQITAEQGLNLATDKNPNSFTIASKFVTAADLVRTTPTYMTNFELQVHAFSYNRSSQPMINQRVVNESAAFVDYINENLTH